MWTIYRLPVQDDGTDGTPDHNCPLRNDGTGHGPCIGDYPHIGADANGFYITTNEYAFFPDNIYMSAQIYAFSKSALASGAANVAVTQFDTTGAVNSVTGPQPGFTVWPAVSPGTAYESGANGTEYFLSSNAAEEATGAGGGGTSTELIAWALTNTKSLQSANPALNLSNTVLSVNQYAIPPKAKQPGSGTLADKITTPNVPLGDCVNDTTLSTPFGPGCWQILFFPPEPPPPKSFRGWTRMTPACSRSPSPTASCGARSTRL